MKVKTLKPINDYIIVKATTEKRTIDLSAVSEDNKKRIALESIEVIAIGDQVTKVKVGDKLVINPIVYQYNNRSLSFFYKQELKENEFIVYIKEEEVVGVNRNEEN